MSSYQRDYTILPSDRFCGSISVVGDKSITHRALIIAAISQGISRLSGVNTGDDCMRTVLALRQLGVRIEGPFGDKIIVTGVGLYGLKPTKAPIDCGNSATSMRLLLGLLAGQPFESCLIGDVSLSHRPMQRMIIPLEKMGARIKSAHGKAPITIFGRSELSAIDYDIPVTSAQVKAGLLIASLYARGNLMLKERTKTRNHSELLLGKFGVSLKVDGLLIHIQGGQAPRATSLTIPGDFSAAAFAIVGAIIARFSDITLPNVGVNPTRTGLLAVLKKMGANIRLSGKKHCHLEPVADIHVCNSALRAINVKPEWVASMIDEFPAFLMASVHASGRTCIRGAQELRNKESDRLSIGARALRRLGVIVEEFPDGLCINGGKIQGARVNSAGDHRFVMAFSLAGLLADTPIMINDCQCVANSFQQFCAKMRACGLQIFEGVKMSNKCPIITVDGPSGTGKGTISQLLAQKLGWNLLDSGLLYRVLAKAAKLHEVALDNEAALEVLAAHLDVSFNTTLKTICVILEGQDVTDAIKTQDCGNAASIVGALGKVRAALYERQRAFLQPPGLVADGRDMGTVIFPEAQLKVYLDATIGERAQRRYKQLIEKGINVSIEDIYEELAIRDARDKERVVAPLMPAVNAVIIDTTGLNIEQVLVKILSEVKRVLQVDIDGVPTNAIHSGD